MGKASIVVRINWSEEGVVAWAGTAGRVVQSMALEPLWALSVSPLGNFGRYLMNLHPDFSPLK